MHAKAIKSLLAVSILLLSTALFFNMDSAEAEDMTFTPQSNWWDVLWQHRIGITINASQISTNLTNFPLCINITSTHVKNNAQTDGDDLAFIAADNSTQYAHEIESYNSTTGQLIAWVNITSLSSTTDTFLWLYYGYDDCSSQENSADTWGSDYMMVQHFDENSGNALDSTANGNDGTITGTTQGITGILGPACSFDGDDYITTSLDKYYYTYCCWIKEGNNWTFYANNDTSSFINGTYDGPIKSAIQGSSLSGFSDLYGSSIVWADTDINIDGLSCSGTKDFLEARSFCEGIGGRLPTLAEVENAETKGTGCGYDGQYIWTSTPCSSGHWADEGDPGDVGPKQCVADDSNYYVRVVADQPTQTTASSAFSEITNIKIGELLTASVDEVQVINRILGPDEINTVYNSQKNVTDGGFYSVGSYETIDLDEIPSSPTSAAATSINFTTINISWDKGELAYNTIIEYKHENAYTSGWGRGDGTEIYNGTGRSCSHTDLDDGTTYHYQMWSWNPIGYNDTYTSINNATIQIPPWTYEGWGNRKLVTTTNPIEGYQTKLIIGNTTGGNVTCEGKSNNDFSDLRFTAANGTAIPYWIEEVTENTSCTVWVNNKFNDTLLCMYYNNSTATDASNGNETFPDLFYDMSWDPVDEFTYTYTYRDGDSRYHYWQVPFRTEATKETGRLHIEFRLNSVASRNWAGASSMGLTNGDPSRTDIGWTGTMYYFDNSRWYESWNTDSGATSSQVVTRRYLYNNKSTDGGVEYDGRGRISGYSEGNNYMQDFYWSEDDATWKLYSEDYGSLLKSSTFSTYNPDELESFYLATEGHSKCGNGSVPFYWVDGDTPYLYWYAKGSHYSCSYGTVKYFYNIYIAEYSENEPIYTFAEEEIPLEVRDETPGNEASEVSGLLTNWSCEIFSNVNTTGLIACSNGDDMSWSNAAPGTQTLTFSNYLDYNTTYQVWVNVTDGGSELNETFSFTTEACTISGTITEDYWGGVADVEVIATGPETYTAYTDAEGYYEIDVQDSYGSSTNYNISVSKFAYVFDRNGADYTVENLERKITNINFTGIHYFFKGNGTEDNPFTIKNCTHLNNTRLFLNYSFVMYNDIDMSVCTVDQWNGGNGFRPLGNETTPFNGSFDGGAYTISNFYSNFTDCDYVGLFGYVEDADIGNLGMDQLNISGGNYTGSLIGYANNTTIVKTFVRSNYSLEGNNVAGGLFGSFNNGTINESYARINVTGTTYGGIVGTLNDAVVNYTYSSGDVTGGGGLIESQTNSIINNSYYDNQTSGTMESGGGIGKNTSDLTSQSFWDTTNYSFPDIWFLDENQNDQYPILSIFTEITPPLLRDVNYAGSKTQQLTRYLNSSFNPEDYCFFNVTAYVPSERYIGRWNKNVSDKYFIATGDITSEPDYNDTENNYVLASKYTCDYTGYYTNIRVFTIWHGMYPAHIGAAVCTDSNDEPGEVLGVTEAYTIPEGRDEIWFPDTSHVWIELNLTEPVFMAKDTDYWLMATSNDSSMWRESKYGDYNLSTYSDFAWLLGRADGPSTDNVKRLAYNVTLDIPNKELADPYAGTEYEGYYAYWQGDVQNASFEWPSTFAGKSWSQGVDSMTTELNETAEPVPLTELLIYATTTVDVSPVNITKVEMTWGAGQGDNVVWDDPVNMSRVSPNLNYWEYNKTNLPGGEWNTWKMTLYDEFGNVESYDYYRYLKHGITERITFQVNASSPSGGDPYKEISSETDLYSPDWVFYLYEADYDDTMYIYGDNEGRKQVLRHEQGVDGSSTDSGYWRTDEPTDEFQERTCAFFVGGAFDQNVVIPEGVTIENAVLVWWLASGRQIEGSYWAPPYNDVGTNFHWGRADTESSYDEFYIRDLGFGEWRQKMYDAKEDTLAWQTFPQTRRYLNDWINFEEDTWYGSDTPSFDNSTGRLTNYMGRQMVDRINFSSLSDTEYPNTFDSNSIYQLFIGMDYDAGWASGPNAAIFNNRSHASFVIFNVPDNETLKATDSNNDGINDYEKINLYGLHPFWNDTDNDSFSDIQELSRDCGANLYREFPSDSNIILLKNMTPLIGNDTEDWMKTLSIDVENPNGQNMDVKWYVLRNFTFNSSYINQNQLLEGEWELAQTNTSATNGTYTMSYEPAAGDNYVSVNTSDSSGWWGNRTFEFSGPGRNIEGTVTYGGSGLGGAKVTATVNGDSYIRLTDEESGTSGTYAFTDMDGGNYTITPEYQDMYFIPQNRTIYLSTENVTANFEGKDAPTVSDEYPQNNTEHVNETITWSALMTYDAAFNWTIECSDGNSSGSTEDTTGTKQLSLSNLDNGQWYTVWVNVSHASYPYIKTNEIYYFKVRELKTDYPGIPTKLNTTAISISQINITWTKGIDADYTHIRYAQGTTPPANRESGIFIYNNTGTETMVAGLSMGTDYAFSAWSYNQTYNSWSYLTSNTTETQFEELRDESPINATQDQPLEFIWSINLTNPIGDLFNWTIECSNGQSTGLDNDTNGTKEIALSNLEYSREYTVWVNMTYNPTISKWYTFTTQDQEVESDVINITLGPGAEANIVVNKTEWMPSIGITQNESTGNNWANIDNNGSVSVSINVTVSNTTNWTAATMPGHNQFNISIYTGIDWLIMDTTEKVFITNLGYNQDQDFGLQLFMPTSTETNTNQIATITFVATAD